MKGRVATGSEWDSSILDGWGVDLLCTLALTCFLDTDSLVFADIHVLIVRRQRHFCITDEG